MKLITETNFQDIEILTESVGDSKKNYYIEGIYLQGEIRNRNGRKYPMDVLNPEVARYITESVNKNCGWGQLNHPATPTIELDKVSHRILSLTKEGNNYIGKALLVTENAPGRIAMNLIETGGKLGVSSRALGSLRKIDGVDIVQEDLRIVTAADIVADPSAPDAFVNGIMESQEWILNNGMIEEADMISLQTDVRNTFGVKTHKHFMEEKRVNSFRKFLLGISKY